LIDGIRDWRSLVDDLNAPLVESKVYAKVTAASVGFDPVAQVALVYGTGNIMAGGDTPTGGTRFAAETASEAVLDAAADPEIDAIVLRIDSPGGSAMASEQIWQAIMRAKAESGKPIIASFSDVAASGGYYVATAADAIVTPPGALTGSIGVYMLRPGLGGVLDKLGIHVESLTRGRHADFALSTEPLSEGTRSRLEQMAMETYRLFSKRVAEGRELDADQVEEVAQGRVWTGEQALEAGLVDALGGLHKAVALVRAELGLDEDADVALLPYPAEPSLGEQIASLLEGRVQSLAAILPERGLGSMPGLVRTLEALVFELPTDAPLLIPPLLVDIR
jgi:protease-4